ncbi:anti-sigma regulatory factor [Pseudonocardia ailaonensis]|uniref:Anti-sigma regulatory factor n=1 Tax=Pseudonocardia ailaonensis TaxID=367279 RepID=A0ABN2N323_9PSEU
MPEVDPLGAGEVSGTVETPGTLVEVRTSASAALIPTIRAVASDLAARADFDLDAISDLRMAVDEACATLVDVAAPGSALRCVFDVREELIGVHAEVDVKGAGATAVSTDTFGWRVLQTLADQVELEADGARVGIRLHKRADAQAT